MSITLNWAKTRYRDIVKDTYYSLPKYTTGTIIVTTGTRTITGSTTGTVTAWLANVNAGEDFYCSTDNGGDGRHYTIELVNSNSSITLTDTYKGATISSYKSYVISGGSIPEYGVVDDLNLAHRRIVGEINRLDDTILATSENVSYNGTDELYTLTAGIVRVINVGGNDDVQYHFIPYQERYQYIDNTTLVYNDTTYNRYYLLGSQIGILTTLSSDTVVVRYAPKATDVYTDGYQTSGNTYQCPDSFAEALCLLAASYRKPELKPLAEAELQRELYNLSPRQTQESNMVRDLTDYS